MSQILSFALFKADFAQTCFLVPISVLWVFSGMVNGRILENSSSMAESSKRQNLTPRVTAVSFRAGECLVKHLILIISSGVGSTAASRVNGQRSGTSEQWLGNAFVYSNGSVD